MPTIRVKENEPFEVALRRFKRTIEKSGLLTELRAREFYEKPTAERKRKKAAAVKTLQAPAQHDAPQEALLIRVSARALEAGGRRSPCCRLGGGTKLHRQTIFSSRRMVMIKDRIREDMKAAMRAHDAAGLSTIRLLLAAIKQREVDEQIEADDALILSVIAKMVKQRQDSVQQYLAGDRQDLADKESVEIKVLEAYLPKGLSDEEIAAVIDAAVAEVGATGMAAMGKVMAIVKPKVTGRADMGKVSALVKAKLTA